MRFCESLTFCAPNKVNTDRNIEKHAMTLGFRGWGIFCDKKIDVESQCFGTYSPQYVVI